MDLAEWRGVDTKTLKISIPKTLLSEDIGSRVRRRQAKDQLPGQDDGSGDDPSIGVEKIREIIQNVVFEAQWVAYSIDNYDWRTVIANEAMRGMFGDRIINTVISTLNANPSLAQIVRDHLAVKQQAYANLPYREVYDELFGNSKLKQSIGMVYVPYGLAEELINHLSEHLG
jgi:hypothetical protein